jgi:hypothetical protein
MVHCDVPNIFLGIQPATVGATIMIAPRATTCSEPDVICNTCVRASGSLALGFLLVAALSGLIFFFQVRNVMRDIQNKSA